MLGLGAALSGPYSSSLGSQNALHGGGWTLPGRDFEAELTSLKTSIDTTHRSLTQLENKLGGRLEHICRRHVEDALTGSGHLQEVKQGLSRLQHECRHLGLEAGRLPSAQDVDEALERHRHAVEERTAERINNLERTVTQQHQLAVERLEGRGGETWRVCLQRMSALEERVVMQSDTPRLIEHALNEVRRAGPDLFGAAGTSPSAEVSMLKSAIRKLEVKLAGCEARVLGLSEDTTAEGRVWRASVGAKIETADRLQQDMSGRLSGCEAGLKAVEENTRLALESAQAAALEAQKRAESAEALTLDAKSDALRHAEVVLQNALAGLESRTQERTDAQRREVSTLQKHLQELAFDMVTVKQESAEAGKDRILAREQLSFFGTEMEALDARVNAVATTAKETCVHELERGVSALKQEIKLLLAKSFEPLKASLEQLSVKVSSADARMNSTTGRIDGLEERLTRLDARVQAPGKAMEQMISSMSGFSTGVLHASREMGSQSIASQMAPSMHTAQNEGGRFHATRVHQGEVSSRIPELSQTWVPVQAMRSEDEEVFHAPSPPVYSFGQGSERPPRIPVEIENSPSVPDPSFGEVSRLETQTFVSNAPAFSPGEVCSFASALMSATPSRVPGDAIGEETGIRPSDFGLAEDDDANLSAAVRHTEHSNGYEHNPWDDTDEEDRPPAVEDVLSPPTLGPMQAESEGGSNLSVPLPEDAGGTLYSKSAAVTQPQAMAQQPRAQPERQRIKVEAASFLGDQEVTELEISGSLEGEVASQTTKRAENLPSRGYQPQDVPPAVGRDDLAGFGHDSSGTIDERIVTGQREQTRGQQLVIDPEGSVSDWDASGSLEGSALRAVVSKARAVAVPEVMPKAKSSPTLPDHTDQAGSDWDASGSFDGVGLQAISQKELVAKSGSSPAVPIGSEHRAKKTSATVPEVMPKAKTISTFPEPTDTAGSDWDASGSFDGAGLQAMAKKELVAKSASSSSVPGGPAHRVAATTEPLEDSVSDWDASGSFDGARAHRATRGPPKAPSAVGGTGAKTVEEKRSAPLVGLGGASRFGVESSLDVLQNSTSFDEPGPRVNLEASNSWDMGSPTPTPQAASKAQPATTPKAVPKEPAAPVVGPQSGQQSAREQQLKFAADLGLDLNSEASEHDEDDGDVYIPGM